MNVTVTDVAWSLPQSYVTAESGYHRGGRNAAGAAGGGVSPGGDTGGSSVEMEDAAMNGSEQQLQQQQQQLQQHPGHYPSFIKRVRANTAARGQTYDASWRHRADESSIVAAAGSNGVVVAWRHSSLLENNTMSSASPPNRVPSSTGLFHGGRTRERAASSSSAIGPPEAAFSAHSRAVNRLSWHPTGNRPYLLLTASQDGTAKLWDRRASSPEAEAKAAASVATASNARTWFGFGGARVAAERTSSLASADLPTSSWHCVSTYTPKCEAVRILCIILYTAISLRVDS